MAVLSRGDGDRGMFEWYRTGTTLVSVGRQDRHPLIRNAVSPS